MILPTPRRLLPAALLLLVVALAGLTVAAATSTAHDHPKRTTQQLVVRGDATVKDVPCAGGLCLELSDGAFRGTPVGTGAYSGRVELKIANAFPNGEGGLCAPIRGDIVLGAGSPDRLVLAVSGDSCQDGAGNPATSSFTGLAHFWVKYGTGAYAKTSGDGIATFAEDAADHDRMTLVGQITTR